MKVYETLKVLVEEGYHFDHKKEISVVVLSHDKNPNNTLVFEICNSALFVYKVVLKRSLTEQELLELSFYRPNKKFEVIKKMLRDEIDESYKTQLRKFGEDNRKEIIEKCKHISKFCKDPLITDIYIDYDKVFGFPMNKDTFIYLVKDVLHITSGSDLNCKWNIF